MLYGRPHLVAPISLIVPGVLNGSDGPILYPENQTAKNYSDWNGMPIVVYHPTVEVDGMMIPVTARDPDILNKQGIGHVFRSSHRGKLGAEAWFDEELTKKADELLQADGKPTILNRLLKGQPIEVSTGLNLDKIKAPLGSTHNGRPYTFIGTNYRPDHLAILPDQRGACSVADGCGVLINESNRFTCPSCGAKVKPTPGGLLPDHCPKCGAGMSKKPTANAKGKKPSSKLAMTPDKACKIMKDGTAQGHPLSKKQKGMFGALCGTTHNEVSMTTTEKLVSTVLANFNTCHDAMGLFCHTGSGKAAAASRLASKRGARVDHANAAKEHKKAAAYHRENGNDDAAALHSAAAKFHKKKAGGVTANRGDNMAALTAKQRKAYVNYLTVNCDCWKGEEATLNGMSDDQLRKLKKREDQAAGHSAVVNALSASFGQDLLTVNAEDLAGELRKRVTGNADSPAAEADDSVDDEELMPKKKGKKKVTANSTAEWLARDDVPQEVKEVVANSIKADKQRKAALVGRLIANVQEEDRRKAMFSKYMKMSTPDIQELVSLMPGRGGVNNMDILDDAQYYPGAAGGPAVLNSEEAEGLESEDVSLMTPVTINYDDLAGAGVLKAARAGINGAS